jgi:hypothetical protein
MVLWFDKRVRILMGFGLVMVAMLVSCDSKTQEQNKAVAEYQSETIDTESLIFPAYDGCGGDPNLLRSSRFIRLEGVSIKNDYDSLGFLKATLGSGILGNIYFHKVQGKLYYEDAAAGLYLVDSQVFEAMKGQIKKIDFAGVEKTGTIFVLVSSGGHDLCVMDLNVFRKEITCILPCYDSLLAKMSYSEWEAVTTANVEKIIQLIVEMPDWTGFSLNQEYPEEIAKIERIAREISSYNLDEIRAAISKLLREAAKPYDFIILQGKFYVLNKYFFNLPETVRRDSPYCRAFGGGWLGMPGTGDFKNPRDDDLVHIRWPWEEDASGQWHVTGKYAGYMGPPYDALAAFDFYRESFGKR